MLSGDARVTVAHGGTERSDDGNVRTVPFEPHRPTPLRALIDDADVIVTHPQWPLLTRWLRHASARMIFDLYHPETLETLELLAGRAPLPRRQLTATTLDRLHDARRTGHHFMCASEKQRDLWLGAMLALRLISPDAYDRDPSFRSVIDLVPFGVPDQPPPASTGPGPRETIAGLETEAELVLWNGGIWSWLDAETAIRAVVLLAERRPQVRLVFMGDDLAIQRRRRHGGGACRRTPAGSTGIGGPFPRGLDPLRAARYVARPVQLRAVGADRASGDALCVSNTCARLLRGVCPSYAQPVTISPHA